MATGVSEEAGASLTKDMQVMSIGDTLQLSYLDVIPSEARREAEIYLMLAHLLFNDVLAPTC